MNETMSSPRSDWVQFYQHNISGQAHTNSNRTTTTTAITSADSGLSPEGRVSKPIRKRSRASRRTPTTLLNTDTANFRAMVQQFTGGPVAPFGSGLSTGPSYPSGTNFNFGLGSGQQTMNPNAVVVPRAGYNFVQQPQQFQQQQHQQYMVSMNNMSNINGDNHGFLQRLQSSRGPPATEVSGGGFGMVGVSSSVPPVMSSSSKKHTIRDNYML